MKDLQKKIKLLLENLYSKNIDELTKAFMVSDNPTSTEIRHRKVTITKWLQGETKNPSKLQDYNTYPISKILTLSTFTDSSFRNFKLKLEAYQNRKNNSLERYKYIYYYKEGEENLVYFKINYQDENDSIELSTNHHTREIYYTGEIEKHHGMIHFIMSSREEMVFFSFKENDCIENQNIYGAYLAKDFSSNNPKMGRVLLSNGILNENEETLAKRKINHSNIIIAENNRREDNTLVNTFLIHLNILQNNIECYLFKDIFLNLFFNEFNSFYYNFERLYKKERFAVTSFLDTIQSTLELLEHSTEKKNIKVIYTITEVETSLFSSSDTHAIELYNYFLKLTENQKISFEFIIAIDKIEITQKLEDKFRAFHDGNIPVICILPSDTIAYSDIFLIDDYPLAIFALKEETYYVTTDTTKIKELRKKYDKLENNFDTSLQTILDRDYTLNGKWYLYGYDSNKSLHSSTIEIDGKRADIVLITQNKQRYKGERYEKYGDIVLHSELGIIKFRDDKKNIKVVSVISDQYYGDAILSRVELKKEDIDTVLF